MPVQPSSITIDLSRDDTLNDFTLQTLKERYLVDGETSPQQAFARAAAAFADDEAHAQRIYDYVSRGWFMFATPLLSNGGTTRGLPISCFLTAVEDSRESISEHYDEMIWLSSMGGGVGSYWGELRSSEERTSKGSKSTGVIPFMAVDDRLILAVSQGGTRRGSEAVYLDIDHPEIEEFIVARKATGGDRNRKIENLHNAVNVTDEFMIAVRDDLDFHLRSPKDRSVRKTVKARDLWRLLLETRMQTGEPYIHYVDTTNRALPEAQKKLGLKVKQSNLCVAPQTELLTRQGYKPIGGLKDQVVEVWNGQEFSTVTVRETSPDEELLRVWFEDGDYIDCTPYHKFHLEDGSTVRAIDLRDGDVLEKMAYPDLAVAQGIGPNDLSPLIRRAFEQAYASGWATFAGFEDANRLAVSIPDALPDAILKRMMHASADAETSDGVTTVRFDPQALTSGRAPLGRDEWYQKHWLGGALDAAGDWIEIDGLRWLSLGSTDVDLIREMRRVALECGLTPRVRLTDTMNAFMLAEGDVADLADERAILRYADDVKADGLAALWADYEGGYCAQPIDRIVADIHPLPYRSPVYCATEPKRNRLVFNGYLTGNCTEITLATGRDHLGKMRTAVCCLSSVNAETYPEWKDHPTFIEDLMRMLDNCLQVFIDNAPPQMERAIYSAMRERSVGLGLLGFQSYLQSLNVAMDSMEARRINKRLFRHLRKQADAASLKLGAERGEAPDMEGTGERFAHKLAIAPNASSSIIIPTPMGSGASPSIEPARANAYLHKTLSGSFPVRNPYLKRRLAELGQDTEEVWKSIVANEGSVQHLDFLTDHDKAVFATAMEIDQLALVRLNADRTPDICQAVSLNLFLPHSADAGDLHEAHFLAWEWGVKSLYYLRSTTPKRAENTNEKIERREVRGEETPAAFDLASLVAAAGPVVEDETCFNCQG